MSDEQNNAEKPGLVDILVVELKQLETTGQRHRDYTGQTSPRYDDYMHEVMVGWDLKPRVKVMTAIGIIKDAFHCGLNVEPYIATLRAYCTEKKVEPDDGMIKEILRR